MTDFDNISVLVVTSPREPKTRMVNDSTARYTLLIGCDETKDAEVFFFLKKRTIMYFNCDRVSA